MYLWDCYAVSIGCEPTGLVVAIDKQTAEDKFKKQLDDEHIWYGSVYSEKVVEVDGYKITLTKMK